MLDHHDTEAIIYRIARETIWGYRRGQGELLKFDVTLSCHGAGNERT